MWEYVFGWGWVLVIVGWAALRIAFAERMRGRNRLLRWFFGTVEEGEYVTRFTHGVPRGRPPRMWRRRPS